MRGRPLAERKHDIAKRGIDITVGVVLIALTLPAMLVAAVGSAITFRAWPFFVQDRIGRDGRTFRFVKIRTLPPAAAPYASKYQLDMDELPAFARLLRRLHLDELPQLFLLPLGHMSLVGPRPEMPSLHANMPEPFADARTGVRPGCTGLWQVSEGVHGLISESPEYDLYYLRHRGLRLDAWILARTFLVMGTAGRRVTLDEVPGWTRRRVELAGEIVVGPTATEAAADRTAAAVSA